MAPRDTDISVGMQDLSLTPPSQMGAEGADGVSQAPTASRPAGSHPRGGETTPVPEDPVLDAHLHDNGAGPSTPMAVDAVGSLPRPQVRLGVGGGPSPEAPAPRWPRPAPPSELWICRMCPPGPAPFHAKCARGLVMHLAHTHRGESLTTTMVEQLRVLDRGACCICSSIRLRSSPVCSWCTVATPTRALQTGDIIPDRWAGQTPVSLRPNRQAPAPAGHPSTGSVPSAPNPTAPSQSAGAPESAPSSGPAAEDDFPPRVPGRCRPVHLSEASLRTLPQLQRSTLLHIPRCVTSALADSMAEALEGSLDGHEGWATLARFRARLLLATVPAGADRNKELKRRLQLWEQGHFDSLILHIAGQQAANQAQQPEDLFESPDDDDKRRRRAARTQAAAGAVRKAMQSLVGGLAPGSPEDRLQWTRDLVPRSGLPNSPCTSEAEATFAKECAWGRGDVAEARQAMKDAGRQGGGPPGIPWVRLAPLSAPGPSGERQEHLDDIMGSAGFRHKRRLRRVLDELTVLLAVGQLPPTCRWILNTQLLFLSKAKDPHDKLFDQESWLEEHQHIVAGLNQDIPEALVTDDGRATPDPNPAATPKAPRPIQMGEWLRKWMGRRLLRLGAGDTARVMLAARQLGVGMPGGAEALALFHQEIFSLWDKGQLSIPLARVKIDETNCFGRLEWPAIRQAAARELPRHAAVLAWKHAARSSVEQPGVDPHEKDRGAEQGDVDGPLECGITMAGVAAEARSAIHAAQSMGSLPWAPGAAPQEAKLAQAERTRRAAQWAATHPQARRSEMDSRTIVPDPRHEIQQGGGIADHWYLDDGDVLTLPHLVAPYLQAFDEANAKVGAVRNRTKTEVIFYATPEELSNHHQDWQVDFLQTQATLTSAGSEEGMVTLGIVTGHQKAVVHQVAQKRQVVQAMYQKAEVCQDAQTEHVLGRQSLGVSRLNHVLRVHGHNLHTQDTALRKFDVASQAALGRLFPGISAEGHLQASLAVARGGLGWRRATDIALAANLAALVAATPKVHSMAKDVAKAGLMPLGLLEAAYAERTRAVREAFLATLDEAERVKASSYITAAAKAAEDQWQAVDKGGGWTSTRAPRADASFGGVEEFLADPGDDGLDATPDGRTLTPGNLQKELCRLLDCTNLRHLETTLRSQGNWPQLARLNELRHPEVSHSWLWHLDRATGSVLSEEDYVLNVQKRVGAVILETQEDTPQCRLCEGHMDPQAEHCETCSIGEATKGHYACVRAMVAGLRLADPTVTTEPQGLSASQARPADILTNAAVPGRSAALDLCVASPLAAAAGGDAAEAAFKRKLRHYAAILPELQQAGIAFRPLIWTADGRPHPAATRTLKYAAERASYKGGRATSASEYYRRWCHELQIAILRRRAAMVRAGMPKKEMEMPWLGAVEQADAAPRLPTIEEDESLPVRPDHAWEPDNLFCATLGGA